MFEDVGSDYQIYAAQAYATAFGMVLEQSFMKSGCQWKGNRPMLTRFFGMLVPYPRIIGKVCQAT